MKSVASSLTGYIKGSVTALFLLLAIFIGCRVSAARTEYVYEYNDGILTKIREDNSTARLIVAEFEDDGTFKTCSLSSLDMDLGDTISLQEYEDTGNFKIYVWDDLNGMQPLSAAIDTKSDTPIYGIRINRLTGECSRIEAAKNLQNDYMVGDAYALNGGVNDFDACYPWSAIKLCNVSTEGVVTYHDYPTFDRYGKNGDVMVEIPKFYSYRSVEDNYETILISEYKHPGFRCEPMFLDSNNKELDRVYIGAYATKDGRSYSGVLPRAGYTMEKHQQMARARNADIYSVDCWSAIQKLVSIEFGTINMSSHLNGIGDFIYRGGVTATKAYDSTNEAYFEGEISSGICKLEVGDWIAIDTGTISYNNRQVTDIEYIGYDTETKKYEYRIAFSGDPVSVKIVRTYLYSTGQPSGLTDNIEYHTGRVKRKNNVSGETWDNMSAQFKYRHMEGLWGNVWTQLGGIKIKNKTYYYTKNCDYYCSEIDENWQAVGFSAPVQNHYPSTDHPWIVNMGFDEKLPLLALPSVVGADNGGGASAFYGDGFYSYYDEDQKGAALDTDTEWCAISGGGWDHLDKNGPYAIRFWSEDGKSWLYGSRLVRY